MKSAFILPVLLCLAACQKEEVQSLRKDAANSSPTATGNSGREEPEAGRGKLTDSAEAYIAALVGLNSCRTQVAKDEALLECKPSELRNFTNKGVTVDFIREHLGKAQAEERDAAEQLRKAKEAFLQSNPDPAVAARIEAHGKALLESADQYYQLDRELHSDFRSYVQRTPEREKLEHAYLDLRIKPALEIVSPPASR